MDRVTALENTCVLVTPSRLVNEAFRAAKDNIARTMRWYTLGWGMSNAPHIYAIVVGRDTGWMGVGIDYVAGWFPPEALRAFRDRQKPNGQILEYIDLEGGKTDDYGLNVADNTPLWIWAAWHHWKQYADEAFRAEFGGAVGKAARHLVAEAGPDGLQASVPAGTGMRGITSWRNIIEGYTLAGQVTEINSLASMALRMAAEFTGEAGFAEAARRIADAVNAQLWAGDGYLLNRTGGRANPQVTGDMVFPLFTGIADEGRARRVLERLGKPDFWTDRGMRTVPNSDPGYEPAKHWGLLGGSWPNLTLWYAYAVARHDPDLALRAIEAVAKPVVEPQPEGAGVTAGEFPEWFHGDTGANGGMRLSPWVPPTFIWAVMEGLLGLTWEKGEPRAKPRWPSGWNEVEVRRLPCAGGVRDLFLRR